MCVFQCLKPRKSLCFNWVHLLLLLLLLLLWNCLLFYLQYLFQLRVFWSLSPISCQFVLTRHLNYLFSEFLLLESYHFGFPPSRPADHKWCHFVVILISVSTFVFSDFYSQICKNAPPILSVGFSLPTHREIVISTFIELAEHTDCILLHMRYRCKRSLKLRPTGRKWPPSGQLMSSSKTAGTYSAHRDWLLHSAPFCHCFGIV